jgi:hypothetical protein
MRQKDVFTRLLALAGTALAWFPIVATVLLTGVGSITARAWRLDYLMPAELFPAAVLGGGLLLWATLRAHTRRALVGGSLGVAMGMLVGGQALAVVTGLASGRTRPDGWAWVLVLASLGVYTLALVALGGGGALLLRDLYGQPPGRGARAERYDGVRPGPHRRG